LLSVPRLPKLLSLKLKPARVDIPRGGVHQVYKQCLSVRAAEGVWVLRGQRHAKGTILRPVHAVSSGEIPLTGGFLWVIEECACDLARSKPKTLIFGHLGLDGFDAHKVGLWGVHVGRPSSTRGARSQSALFSCRHRVGRLTLNFRNNRLRAARDIFLV
jgi:hypothetical protein